MEILMAYMTVTLDFCLEQQMKVDTHEKYSGSNTHPADPEPDVWFLAEHHF